MSVPLFLYLTLSLRPLLRHSYHIAWPTLTVQLSNSETIAVCCGRQTMFVTLYLPTIPTQALDTLYIWKWEQLQMLQSLAMFDWHFGAEHGVNPWLSCPGDTRKWCLEASRRKTPGNALRHHVGICLGMPQGIMRSERVKGIPIFSTPT